MARIRLEIRSPNETLKLKAIMLTKEKSDSFVNKTRLEQFNAYLHSQLRDRRSTQKSPHPSITLSNQVGSGGDEIATLLAKRLQDSEPGGSIPWTVFDRGLVEKALKDHHMPQSLAKYITEERQPYIKELIEEIAGLHPPSWVMVPKIAETVLHLANVGHVILVGRGANIITERLPHVFHVRLIAPTPKRIARLQNSQGLTTKEAGDLVAKSDRGRGSYLKTHFHAKEGDDLHYHLVINTDRIPLPDAAQLIADGARRSFSR